MTALLILIGGGCELASPVYEADKQLVPERGASPFPTIESDSYKSYSTGMREKGAEGDAMQVDWDRLRQEIKPMQDQLGREHIAFYSQYDPDSNQYTYSPHGLIFSDEAVAQAEGESGLILYEIQHPESKHLNKVVLIHAPISKQAIDEMQIWARGSGSSPAQQNARTSFMSNSVSAGSDPPCGMEGAIYDEVNGEWICPVESDEDVIVTPEPDWMDDPFFDHESLSEEDDNGGLYPPQPGTPECDVAYGCGGGGGPGPVPEPCDGDNPPDYCSEPEPCDTDDEVIDDPAIQEAFSDLWESSNFGSADNTNPESERIEKGGFIVPGAGGGYVFQPMPDALINEEETGPCRITFSPPADLPEGTIYVHTHPYKANEEQNHCIPGETLKYKNRPGVKDRPALERMGLDRGIILDADKIILYTPNESGQPTLIDRCGY